MTQLFAHVEFNHSIRDLGLPKDLEILGPRLQQQNLLDPGTIFDWYRNRQTEFIDYFTENGPEIKK